MARRFITYVDGFNLYYGLRKTPGAKWLDLEALSRRLAPDPDDVLVGVKYFTARVRGTPQEPNAPVRQQVYLRALATLPLVETYFGRFSRTYKFMPTRNPPPPFIEVVKVEEKGSDVALASHLVADGYRGAFDMAVVVSNDTDLCPPMEIVTNLGLPVGVFDPQPANSRRYFAGLADFHVPITPADALSCQFPAVLNDSRGTFYRPKGW